MITHLFCIFLFTDSISCVFESKAIYWSRINTLQIIDYYFSCLQWVSLKVILGFLKVNYAISFPIHFLYIKSCTHFLCPRIVDIFLPLPKRKRNQNYRPAIVIVTALRHNYLCPYERFTSSHLNFKYTLKANGNFQPLAKHYIYSTVIEL